jgi:hypothetical protein
MDETLLNYQDKASTLKRIHDMKTDIKIAKTNECQTLDKQKTHLFGCGKTGLGP